MNRWDRTNLIAIVGIALGALGLLSLAYWIVILPLKFIIWVLGMIVGLIGMIFHLGFWVACLALSFIIGVNRGLNPILCLILGMFGPVGLLIVIALAFARPVRSF
jgi:hypothetical protein